MKYYEKLTTVDKTFILYHRNIYIRSWQRRRSIVPGRAGLARAPVSRQWSRWRACASLGAPTAPNSESRQELDICKYT